MGPIEILQQGLQILFVLTQIGVCNQGQVVRQQGRPPETAIVCFQADFVAAFERLAPGINTTPPEPPQNPNNVK